MTQSEHSKMKEAAAEIRSLRRQIELKDARLDMFDQMMVLLHSEPARRTGMGMSPDIAWELDRMAENAIVVPDPPRPTKESTTAAYNEQQDTYAQQEKLPGQTKL